MKKRIPYGSKIKVRFTQRDRDLILNHTLAGPDETKQLVRARKREGVYIGSYSLNELDELLGFVAAEANHTKNRKLQGELDRLYEKLESEMQKYEDGGESLLQSS